MIASNVLAFFALIASTKNFEVSGDNCTSPEALMNCTSKMIEEVMSPDFSKFSESLGEMKLEGPVNITEPQLKVACRFSKNVLPCFGGYLDRCAPEALRTNIHGVLSLLKVCDQPDVYSKAQTLLACYNSSPRFQSCFENMTTAQQDQQSSIAANPRGALRMLQSGAGFQDLLVKYCCQMSTFQECATSEIKERCTHEGAQMVDDVYHALFNANGCQNRTCSDNVSTGNSVRSVTQFLFIGSVLALVGTKLLI